MAEGTAYFLEWYMESTIPPASWTMDCKSSRQHLVPEHPMRIVHASNVLQRRRLLYGVLGAYEKARREVHEVLKVNLPKDIKFHLYFR